MTATVTVTVKGSSMIEDAAGDGNRAAKTLSPRFRGRASARTSRSRRRSRSGEHFLHRSVFVGVGGRIEAEGVGEEQAAQETADLTCCADSALTPAARGCFVRPAEHTTDRSTGRSEGLPLCRFLPRRGAAAIAVVCAEKLRFPQRSTSSSKTHSALPTGDEW